MNFFILGLWKVVGAKFYMLMLANTKLNIQGVNIFLFRTIPEGFLLQIFFSILGQWKAIGAKFYVVILTIQGCNLFSFNAIPEGVRMWIKSILILIKIHFLEVSEFSISLNCTLFSSFSVSFTFGLNWSNSSLQIKTRTACLKFQG